MGDLGDRRDIVGSLNLAAIHALADGVLRQAMVHGRQAMAALLRGVHRGRMPLPTWLLSQLGRPTGLVGSLVARAMDRGNHTMALHTLGALDLRANETLLDLGFGGGVGIALALAHEPTLKVVGVDPSASAVARARARFERATFHEGVAESLPLANGSVDTVLSNNTVYFWTDLGRGLSEVRRVLRPGGRLVLGIRPVEVLDGLGFRARGLRVMSGAAYVEALREAGFVDTAARRMPDGNGTVVVTAVRPER